MYKQESKIIGQLDAELVGLQGVKTRVREISSVLLFDRIRELQDLRSVKFTYAFTGRPGTGKPLLLLKLFSFKRFVSKACK
jgi:hypothetical protein